MKVKMRKNVTLVTIESENNVRGFLAIVSLLRRITLANTTHLPIIDSAHPVLAIDGKISTLYGQCKPIRRKNLIEFF